MKPQEKSAIDIQVSSEENVARILYAELSFHKRFHKVAPCAEHHHHQSHSCPLQGRIKACVVVCKNHADTNGKNRSANRAFPRLVWRDALEQRMRKDKAEAEDQYDQPDGDRRRDRPFRAFVGDLGDRQHRHQRRADDDEQTENDDGLHLCDIVGGAGDQRSGGKAVDLRHREALDRVI